MSAKKEPQPLHPMQVQAQKLGPFSPAFHAATELIGKRWNGAIIYALFSGLAHFSEVKAAIPGLSSKMLSERLKELETHGLVERTVFPETPVRIQYALTAKALALRDVLIAIDNWAQTWHVGNEEEP